MPGYKELGSLHTIAWGARAIAQNVRAWSSVYRSTPDNPWDKGRWKRYLVFDDQKLVVLDTGSRLSRTLRTMLLPLLPRYKDVAAARPDYLSQGKWREDVRVNASEHSVCWRRVEEIPDWQMQDSLDAEQSGYFCFACVGDPFERLVHYLRHPLYMEPLFIPATTFPRRKLDRYPDALRKTVDLILSLPDHALPTGLRTQYSLLHEGDRPLYHQLCRAETFLRDVAPLARRYGLRPPAAEVSEPADFRLMDYRSLYTPELIDLVARRYRRDIDAFGYRSAVYALHEYTTPHYSDAKNDGKAAPPDKVRIPRHKDQARPGKTPRRKIGGYCILDTKYRVHNMLRLLCSTPDRPLEAPLLVCSTLNPKLLYITNPKCASTSIRDIIGGRVLALLKDGIPARLMQLLRGHPSSRSRIAQEFAGKQAPFCFSFVRDPFERLASCYNSKVLRFHNAVQPAYHNSGLLFLYDALGYQKWPASFADFVRLASTTPDHLADAHIRSQYAALHENDELLADYIGKVENFNDDMRYICERFDVPVRTERKNPSPDYDYRDLYTPRLVELAADRYARDVRTFGYEGSLAALRRYVRERPAP